AGRRTGAAQYHRRIGPIDSPASLNPSATAAKSDHVDQEGKKGATLTQREKMYRAYCEVFDTAERKRRWNPFNDNPWEKINPALKTEDDAICLQTLFVRQLFGPGQHFEPLQPDEDYVRRRLVRGQLGL